MLHLRDRQFSSLDIAIDTRFETFEKIVKRVLYVRLTDSLVYFGLTLAATSLAGNRFLNYFLNGAVEYVACFLEYHMMKRYVVWKLHRTKQTLQSSN